MSGVMVTVRGMPLLCWKCSRRSGAVVAVHATDDLRPDAAGWHGDEEALLIARKLLRAAGQTVAAEQLQWRESRAAGRSYLSNGCHHCSALFGTHFLTEEMLGVMNGATESLADFLEMTTGPFDPATWDRMLRDRTMQVG